MEPDYEGYAKPDGYSEWESDRKPMPESMKRKRRIESGKDRNDLLDEAMNKLYQDGLAERLSGIESGLVRTAGEIMMGVPPAIVPEDKFLVNGRDVMDEVDRLKKDLVRLKKIVDDIQNIINEDEHIIQT